MTQLAILVGAGASYGASDRPEFKPPRGDDLFAELVKTYPDTWGNLPKSVAKAFENNKELGFEHGMAALRDEAKHTQAALVDMGAYFANFRAPAYGMNYYSLLGKLLNDFRAKISYDFASLNYECLLEIGLELSGHQIYHSEPLQAPLRNPVLVLKPHGSCNFIADTEGNTITGMKFAGSKVYIDTQRIEIISLDEAAKAQESGIPAAMSLYAPGKENLISPKPIENFRAQWQKMAQNADVILIIGTRPMIESDPHIWQPILDSKAQILFVGTQSGEILRPHLEDRFTRLAGRFEESLPPLKQWLVQL